jgi:hypothetical protein
MRAALSRWLRRHSRFNRGYVAGVTDGLAMVDEATEEAFEDGYGVGYEARDRRVTPPGELVRRGYRRGKSEALGEWATMLDELPDVLGLEGDEQSALRLYAGIVRANAEQFRSASSNPAAALRQ